MPESRITASHTDDWGTPREFFDGLDHEFGFEVDVCATPDNAKCGRFFTPETNGLLQDWAPAVCWMNPPYGRGIVAWVEKAWRESRMGATVVALLPASTDTSWWHDYCEKASERRFIRGRLRFYGRAGRAPFASVVVIWRP
jgi:phage N-6-adenine-methyltransferase